MAVLELNIEDETLYEAERILQSLGLSSEIAVSIFLGGPYLIGKRSWPAALETGLRRTAGSIRIRTKRVKVRFKV
ncbi:hypothetical protein [Acidaminobacter hydrogenoformans]|uniref:Uncharacterized protein n=1 Tax=Acidaminobacter hydrogenoformans DSM 2784 TaxID=1120920 RepID=A0A1G5RXH6_9FIRM|nr:hypothetical protein [Acidaminobacter hydrogenoformans]SCZ78558.1 hypothetical protein SAMN03080599_01292 [Acidaminobacter hydrogenoformans DSM 2784]